MNKATKLFIVEGEDRDIRFITALANVFFRGKYEVKFIALPAEKNIYMMYNLLIRDDFETDIIEVLRDNVPSAKEILSGLKRQDVDEIFLFFDFDAHQNNLSSRLGKTAQEVLNEMIEVFDNETENGKLYISYPMVEALYDFVEGSCMPFTQCRYSVSSFGEYKSVVGTGNINSNLSFDYSDWAKVLDVFGLRMKCLFDVEDLTFTYYRQNVTVKNIFSIQINQLGLTDEIFILSAFPEFLLDYFKQDFWNAHVKMKNLPTGTCTFKTTD